MINVIGYWVSWLRNIVSAHFDDIIWIDNNKILKTYHTCGNAAPQLYYFLISSSRLTTVWDWTWLISLMSSLSLAEVTDARKNESRAADPPHPPLRPPSGPSNQPQPAVTICCCIPLWFSSTTFLLHCPPFRHLLLLFCCRFTHTMCFYRLWVFIFIKKQFKMLKYLIFSFVIFSLVYFSFVSWEHVYFTPGFYSVVIHWLEGICIIHVCIVVFVLYAWCTNGLVDTKLRQCQRFEGKFDFNLKRLLEREYARFDRSKKKKIHMDFSFFSLVLNKSSVHQRCLSLPVV